VEPDLAGKNCRNHKLGPVMHIKQAPCLSEIPIYRSRGECQRPGNLLVGITLAGKSHTIARAWVQSSATRHRKTAAAEQLGGALEGEDSDHLHRAKVKVGPLWTAGTGESA
jgi:hypothetical protein